MVGALRRQYYHTKGRLGSEVAWPDRGGGVAPRAAARMDRGPNSRRRVKSLSGRDIIALPRPHFEAHAMQWPQNDQMSFLIPLMLQEARRN